MCACLRALCVPDQRLRPKKRRCDGGRCRRRGAADDRRRATRVADELMDARAGALIRPKRRFVIIPNTFTAAHCLDRYRERPRARHTRLCRHTPPFAFARARGSTQPHPASGGRADTALDIPRLRFVAPPDQGEGGKQRGLRTLRLPPFRDRRAPRTRDQSPLISRGRDRPP